MVLDALQLLGKVNSVEDEDVRPPINCLVLAVLQLDQGVQGQLEPNAVHGASPLVRLQLVINVHVQAQAGQQRNARPNRIHDEHDGKAHRKSQEACPHVPEPESLLVHTLWPKASRLQPCQHEAREVHKGISHEEAHCQQWRHGVHIPDQYKQTGYDVSAKQRPHWFPGLGERRQGRQQAQDPVIRDGLEQLGGNDQALQRLAQGRDDDPDVGRMRERVPHNLLHDVSAHDAACQAAALPAALPTWTSFILIDKALQVAVVRNHAPQYEEGRIHEKAEDDGPEGPLFDVLRRVPQDICAVRSREDTREAWEEHAEHNSEACLVVVVRSPILLEHLPTQACHPWVVQRIHQRCVRRREKPEVIRKQRVENDEDEKDTQLGDKVDASPDKAHQHNQRHGAIDRLCCPSKVQTRSSHEEALHRTEGLEHCQKCDREKVHDPDGSAHHGPECSRDHVVGPTFAHNAARGNDG
mmetsp:Transcript_111739/g.288772  ORF Transcript_111739/g.288772 Transcript_111739/m.288772 type:complete len:468 (+) Transcript_111739:308-1711(+)